MVELNSREIAILAWLAVVLAACLLKKDLRKSLGAVVGFLLQVKIIIPLLLLAGWIAGEVWLGSRLGIWRPDLTKETLIWGITSGLVMFFKYDEAAKQPRYFRRRIVDAFKITVYIEVFINLFVLSLLAELILQPVLVFIVMISAVAGFKPEHKPVKRLMDGLLIIIGVGLLLLVSKNLIASWHMIDKFDLVLQFALPVWLAIGLLPFVYVIALYANYETTFLRVGAFGKNWRDRLRARAALVIGLSIQARKVGSFGGIWLQRVTDAPTLSAAIKVVRAYRKQ